MLYHQHTFLDTITHFCGLPHYPSSDYHSHPFPVGLRNDSLAMRYNFVTEKPFVDKRNYCVTQKLLRRVLQRNYCVTEKLLLCYRETIVGKRNDCVEHCHTILSGHQSWARPAAIGPLGELVAVSWKSFFLPSVIIIASNVIIIAGNVITIIIAENVIILTNFMTAL